MSKISATFLVGFALASGLGAAAAQGTPDASAISNSLSSQSLSMDSMRSQVRLGEAGPKNPFAEAASSLISPPSGAGLNLPVDLPVATAKIGGGTDFSLPGNALLGPSKDIATNMASALDTTEHLAGGDPMTSQIVLGTAAPDLSNMIGDQIRSSQTLGK